MVARKCFIRDKKASYTIRFLIKIDEKLKKEILSIMKTEKDYMLHFQTEK
jgi:hypothetical protein